MTHYQDFDEFGLLIHTESQVFEFFTGSKLFECNDLKGQVKDACVNQELTIMIAKDAISSKKLILKLANTKELKAYSEVLKKHQSDLKTI